MTDHDAHQPAETRPRRVAVVLENLKRGGVQQGMLQLLPRLDPRRFEVQVWVLRGRGLNGELTGEFEEAGVPLRVAPVQGPDDWRGVLKMARRFREARVDLVNTRSLMPNLIGGSAAAAAALPLIASWHGTYVYRWRPKYVALQKALRRETDLCLCIADAVRDYVQPLLELDDSRVRLVQNGLDIERYDPGLSRDEARRRLGLEPDVPWLAVSVGRLTEGKDVAAFLEAVRLLHERRPGGLALVVGDGDSRGELEEMAAARLPAGGARFLGSRDDVPVILRAADCLVMTSRHEGMPRVILEAFASGTPVVSTPAGGAAELVRDGETGRLVDFGAPEAVADAVDNIVGDPDGAERMVRRARRDVEAFGLAGWAERTAALFDEALATRRPNASAPGRAAMLGRLARLRLRYRLERLTHRNVPIPGQTNDAKGVSTAQ